MSTPTKWRVIQRSADGLHGLAIYLAGPGVDADRDGVGDLDEAIAAALPGVGVVATVGSGLHDTANDLIRAAAACGAARIDGLAGFSAGCQGVRAHLLRGYDVDAVLVVDGTHSEWPRLSPLHLGLWREQGVKARRGERLFVATSTAQRYTQRLARPFAATSTVLAEALGLPELGTYPAERTPLATYPGLPRVQHHDGDLHVLGYPGTDCDARAHATQLTHVLPWLCEQYLAPRWCKPAEQGGGLSATLSAWWGRAVDVATRLVEGMDSEVVRGLELSHGARCSVAELIADARARGRYHRTSGLYVPRMGDLVCSARAGGNPERGGSGHVEIVYELTDDPRRPRTVGGNESDRWILDALDLRGPQVLGIIEQPAELGEAIARIALEQADAAVREIPGPRAHPQIQAYHALARRGGSPLAGMPGHEQEGVATLGAAASDEVPWCASAASWCVYQAIQQRRAPL
jgi:hypothetical protein